MSNPYKSRAKHAFWSSEVAGPGLTTMPHLPYAPFITKKMRIGTAGSCFAQHIARRLANSGYSFHVEEKAPSFVPEEIARVFGYGLFSARYGNIYTVRQLLQLLQRAEQGWDAQEAPWTRGQRFVDPFRPTATPHGHETAEDVIAEQRVHLAAVRRLFRNVDVFVFTLGLTECWLTRKTGAALPVCPGTSAGGSFDPAVYRFENFDYSAVRSDLEAFIALARSINSSLRFIFTVSPVPLVATMEDHSVLTATTYSKSVLRAAVGDVERAFPYVYYFPSYEIITGNFSRGRYFESDLRNVRDDGVDHVMSLFFHSLCIGEAAQMAPQGFGGAEEPESRSQPRFKPRGPIGDRGSATNSPAAGTADFVDLVCDETLLEQD